MYLTNNERTIYNLVVYSNGVYTRKNIKFGWISPRWGNLYYYNNRPYGNIDKEVKINYININKYY